MKCVHSDNDDDDDGEGDKDADDNRNYYREEHYFRSWRTTLDVWIAGLNAAHSVVRVARAGIRVVCRQRGAKAASRTDYRCCLWRTVVEVYKKVNK